MTWTRVGSALVLAGVLAGCGTEPAVVAAATPMATPTATPARPAPESYAADGPRGTLLSTRVTDDGVPRELLPGPDGRRFAVTFTDGRLTASTAGCAELSAPVELRGDRLRVGDLAGVDGSCAARPGEAEADRGARERQHRWLAGLLAADPVFSYSGSHGTLQLLTRLSAVSLAPRDVVQPGIVKPVGDFAATAVTENGAPRPLPPRGVQISFGDDGGAGASGGCNWTSGPVRFEGGRLYFTPEASTAMACGDDQDPWVTAFLEAGPAYAYDGTNLLLTGGAARIEFAPRDVVVPGPPLTQGTRWELSDVFERFPEGSLPERYAQDSLRHTGSYENTEFYLTDSTVRGTAGCASFSGPVELSVSAITFGALAVDRSGCKRSAAPESPKFGDVDWVLALLHGELSSNLSGRSLTLRDPAPARGLTFGGDSAVEMEKRRRELAAVPSPQP